MRVHKHLPWVLLLGVAAAGLALPGFSKAEEASPKSLSTGIGEDRRTPHPEYPLLLIFAKRESGDLGADVEVSIYRRGTKGDEKLFSTFSRGPWFFVDLAPGRYAVEAVFEGKKQGAEFEVKAKGQTRVELAWP